jgi:FKBP12-rapamycin complex-associated protein
MLLVSCLDIVRVREKNPTETYRRIFEEARSGLQKGGSVDSILGSLLAIASLLAGSQMVCLPADGHVVLTAIQFMIEFYQTTCELVLKYKDNKDVGVRKHVITLIPSMATYDSQAFVTHYMHRGMAYLLQSLGKPTDRDFGEYYPATWG